MRLFKRTRQQTAIKEMAHRANCIEKRNMFVSMMSEKMKEVIKNTSALTARNQQLIERLVEQQEQTIKFIEQIKIQQLTIEEGLIQNRFSVDEAKHMTQLLQFLQRQLTNLSISEKRLSEEVEVLIVQSNKAVNIKQQMKQMMTIHISN